MSLYPTSEWADGLGSTTEVGLPACQISRISSIARQFVPDGAFWVDALCVPEAKGLRKEAILLMAETYRRADKVVVSDASIRAFCTSSSSLQELAFRVQASSWMQRLWTLQEAILARELYFEVGDGLIPFSRFENAHREMVELIPSVLGSIPRNILIQRFFPPQMALMFDVEPVESQHPESSNTSATATKNRNMRSTHRYNIVEITRLLTRRTTSKREDETIAIAGLMKFDTAQLLAEQDADARMRVFWLQVKFLPISLLFVCKPTLPYPGFRWAPRSLTGIGPTQPEGLALCTPIGLLVQQELTVISFRSPVEFNGTAADPDKLFVVNLAENLAYYLQDLRRDFGGRRCTVNGIIALSRTRATALPLVEEGSVVAMAAVHVPTHADLSWLSLPKKECVSALRCEFLVGGLLFTEVPWPLIPGSDTYKVARALNIPHVEGTLLSTHLLVT